MPVSKFAPNGRPGASDAETQKWQDVVAKSHQLLAAVEGLQTAMQNEGRDLLQEPEIQQMHTKAEQAKNMAARLNPVGSYEFKRYEFKIRRLTKFNLGPGLRPGALGPGARVPGPAPGPRHRARPPGRGPQGPGP